MKALRVALMAGMMFAPMLSAQTTLPITGWYDGNPSPADGVTHGSNGFLGDGPLNTFWTGLDPYSPTPRILMRDPVNNAGGGAAPSSVLQLYGNTYVFYGIGNKYGETPNGWTDGALQDPIASIVRYPNGHYDQQTWLIWLPNNGTQDPTPTYQPQNIMGNGPFSAAVDTQLSGSQRIVHFFGADEFEQDQGHGEHMIGVATSPADIDAGSTNNHVTFNFSKWFDASQDQYGNYTNPNYNGLKAYVGPTGALDPGTPAYTRVWVDPYNPTTGQYYPSTFTPIIARIARRTDGTQTWVSRFANMTATLLDGYFYLFIGLGGNNEQGAICVRFPFDASQPAYLGHTAGGAVAADMLYDDGSGTPQFHAIDTTKPILFSDDYAAANQSYNENPPVPLANALLKDQNGTYVNYPAGVFQYAPNGTVQSLWMTSRYIYGGNVHIHRFAYNPSAKMTDPFTISTPYQIALDGNCGTTGNCTIPSTYTENTGSPAVPVLSPLTSGNALGYFPVTQSNGSGLLPFTISGLNLY